MEVNGASIVYQNDRFFLSGSVVTTWIVMAAVCIPFFRGFPAPAGGKILSYFPGDVKTGPAFRPVRIYIKDPQIYSAASAVVVPFMLESSSMTRPVWV